MHGYVIGLEEIDASMVGLVGGKGAHLGALTHIAGVRVPPGFCVITEAFDAVVAAAPGFDQRLARLSRLESADRVALRPAAAAVRDLIAGIALPDDMAAEITRAYAALGDSRACAVRSSATAEDLPTASFAGLHDSFLDVGGASSILDHVRRCWASLFTERAVVYRQRNGVDHRDVRMAVVVQAMVSPQASGVLFTADPLTGNRHVITIEAIPGLGEALVGGAVNPDAYRLSKGQVVERRIAVEARTEEARPTAGTPEVERAPGRGSGPVLTDAQLLRLAELGARIATSLGHPQDVEWCLRDDEIYVVQSRPITTLFPAPPAPDGEVHVYISVGHQQMMTDAMKPLGISVWQHTTPRPMTVAGSRLFVDVTAPLASPAAREGLLEAMGRSDPLIRDALDTVIAREGLLPPPPPDAPPAPASLPETELLDADPALVEALIAENQASVATLRREIEGKEGAELVDFIVDDFQELRRLLFDPRSYRAFMSAMEAAWWLNDRMQEWLGEANVADTLALSVPHNVTAEMGLALLDVADAIRPHPQVVEFLEGGVGDDFLEVLPRLQGGEAARDAIEGWLARYGVRCVGEIDITRPRWSERPADLVPLILSNIRNFEPGAGTLRFERGARQAEQKATDLLRRIRALPDGEARAEATRRMIDRLRTFMGYREYPKYGMVSRYFVYRQALLGEAARLVEAGVLPEVEDLFFLTLPELREVVRTRRIDLYVVRERKEEFRWHQGLQPPRVITSEGEAVTGAYRTGEVPEGALVGLGVSAGVVEGRARVISDIAQADLRPGDILVTAFTDPSWTPLFVAAGGLVTEVGGMMTHGAVIAREYGLPAVVGVEQATRRIQDGQWLRVNGAAGFVEVLPDPAPVTGN